MNTAAMFEQSEFWMFPLIMNPVKNFVGKFGTRVQ